MDEEIRPGYYKDKDGNWQRDRRKAPDRRKRRFPMPQNDRRSFYRRKTDREILERDAQDQIEEALEEFEAEHEDAGD